MEEEFSYFRKMDPTMRALGRMTICGDTADSSHLIPTMKEKLPVDWPMGMELSKMLLRSIWDNGVMTNGREREKSDLSKLVFYTKEISPTISITERELYSKQTIPIQEILRME